MKTSNIILLSFFILVFLTPLFISLALMRKVDKGEYVTAKAPANPYVHQLATGKYSVLNLDGNPHTFNCAIIIDDSSYIEYDEMGERDSVSFNKVNDTLNLSYLTKQHDVYRFDLKIHVSGLSRINADKASVMVFANDYFEKNPLEVALKNNSSLTIYPRGVNPENPDERKIDTSVTSAFKQLVVNTQTSSLALEPYVLVNQLSIKSSGASRISFPPNFQSAQVSASLGDSTQFSGPLSIVKKFKN